MPQSGCSENPGRGVQQLSAFAAILLLKFDGHARAGMRVGKAVNGNFSTAHAVEIRDKCRKTINAKVPPPSYGRPMHTIPQPWNSRQPSARRYELPQSPIRRHKQGDMQLRMPVEQSLEAAERTPCKVSARFIFIKRGCRMNVVDSETYRSLFPRR